MEQQMIGSSSSKDDITTVEVVQDENSTSPMVDEGRYDDLGNYIQNTIVGFYHSAPLPVPYGSIPG